jgi:subtilisin family serine protease
MAEHKDDPGSATKFTQARKATSTQGATVDVPAHHTAAQDRGGAPESIAQEPPAAVVRRKQRYLIGFRALQGVAPLQPDPFLDRLSHMEGVDIIRCLRGNGSPIAQSEMLVACMDEQRGEALRLNAPPHVIFERDTLLGYSHMAVPELMGWQPAVRAMPYPRPRRELRVRVLGEADRPIPNAVVNLYGLGFPAQAITDPSGQASLQADAADGGGAVAIHVRPAADYWERYIHDPSLELGQTNVVRLSPLERTAARFPGERPYGWGQRIMRFDRAPSEWTGAGAKIGIIDSGCDNSHPQLRHIVQGIDLTRERDAQSTRDQDTRGWRLDELAHGTHCAGTIAAATGGPSQAIVGCAPSAEVHVFKVVPGGHTSDLIEALDQCIARNLDIVQIGVSSDQFSELVAQKITEARLHGVACVAAAGNSGGAVQFPGNVPGVLTVSAVGKLGEYPRDTRHAQRTLLQPVGPSGIYATNFSSWGPEIGVCAPGVAIVSSVPGGGYAAWDGSSMAAAHVVGLSALLLAHHPMLQSINYGGRAEQRVSVLFDMLRVAGIPYAQVDQNRVGAGLPDLQRVPGLSPTSQLLANQQFYGSVAMPPALTPPAAFLANSMNAILQLRAAGLWV